MAERRTQNREGRNRTSRSSSILHFAFCICFLYFAVVQREEKTERSRRHVLDAALRLFSRQGYRATSVRDIATAAHVSIGNLYHHFPDKEAIFRTLLDELRDLTGSTEFPFRRVLATGADFPDNLEVLGFAARDSVRQFRPYFAMIYVDVIEFEGEHIRSFYRDLSRRFAELLSNEGTIHAIESRLRPGVSAISALMMATRMFFNYFTIEVLFNVPEPFGKDSGEVVLEMVDVLRHGMAR